MLPSGKLTVCELENGREQFVDLPIKKTTGDFACLCKRLPEGNHLQKLDGLFLLEKNGNVNGLIENQIITCQCP